jgi:hypothetical protein
MLKIILLQLLISNILLGKMMIFGGVNHDVYLGCLSCSKYEFDSVFNEYGNYGSKYSNTSVFNKYGNYGSKYSMYSPCNEYSSTPPVIVDGSGNFYGYLTLNKYMAKAITDNEILSWLKYAVCK